MRILFTGGGTAGHVNPAIAIAEAMQKRHTCISIGFVGREGGDENRAVRSHSYKLYTLNVRGIPRSVSLDAIKSGFLAIKALGKAKKIINDFKPDVIIGTGGYVSWPVLKSGISMGIPTLLHESNIYPGLVTRLLGRKCDMLLLNSEKSLSFLKGVKRFKAVGNPLRGEFSKTGYEGARHSLGIGRSDFFIVSFGGSLGSEKINNAIIELMKSYTSKSVIIKHLHSSGTRYYEKIISENEKLTLGLGNCTVKPYIDNMPTVLTAADLVISRSGAMTLSEIARVGVPAILIPSPNVADNHQYKNAKILSDAGAAIVLNESEIETEALKNCVFDLITDKKRRMKLKENVLKFHDPSSAEKICEQIERAVSGSYTLT